MQLVEREGSLAAYVWRFEPAAESRPAQLTEAVLRAMSTSPESVALSKALKKRGWRFFGPTTAYAFMQAMGLVNDHTEECMVRAHANEARTRFSVPARDTA